MRLLLREKVSGVSLTDEELAERNQTARISHTAALENERRREGFPLGEAVTRMRD